MAKSTKSIIGVAILTTPLLGLHRFLPRYKLQDPEYIASQRALRNDVLINEIGVNVNNFDLEEEVWRLFP